ncbi:YaiI/YqxD family protein [Methylophaga sp. OBS3]|uniref:YaiI/YqxD family protein n=1 Tax=Methylophaga sp. OBS3 TaxID=2991934 RepID=UPI0022506035|nr:YaiI/YqxD family protein [Methylophaga sp. OBS3]MCX4188819.1 YaiI/YqxD family protein [Methylophaga sp. OBS3]
MTEKSKIWVDADACPVVIKEILYRAATRTEIQTTFVANHSLRLPPSPFLTFLQVQSGFDVADNEIVQRLQPGDLVVTADIPLAAEAIEKGALALNPRGELYTKDSIQARLTMRNFMETMRSSGEQISGPASFHQRDRQAFANQLDKWLFNQKK